MKYLIMDVDGTLTDGRIYIGPNGEAMKAFDVKDGYAIRNILPRYEITPIIITGRISSIVEHRAAELGIVHLYQGKQDKAACLQAAMDELGISLNETFCIGDDLNDLPMMELCGVKGCPADAVQEVQSVCDYVCSSPGGHGAVREFVEWLIGSKM